MAFLCQLTGHLFLTFPTAQISALDGLVQARVINQHSANHTVYLRRLIIVAECQVRLLLALQNLSEICLKLLLCAARLLEMRQCLHYCRSGDGCVRQELIEHIPGTSVALQTSPAPPHAELALYPYAFQSAQPCHFPCLA
ncbi:hypothetical protein D3C76_925680 [compost metagenome]